MCYRHRRAPRTEDSMADGLAIWALDEEHKATEVSRTSQTETEELLEEALTNNPEMLESGLTLVGRQLPTAGGPLDLLGVDRDGRLAVFELKRGTLTRDAVAQVIDYGSWLEQTDVETLATLITEKSGSSGIEEIDDVGEWYSQRFEETLESLKPVRMILVGLGVDASARRMVDFLHVRGADIALYTFYGYIHAGATLLAKQVEMAPPEVSEGPTRASRYYRPREMRRQLLTQRAETLGIAGFWADITEELKPEAGQAPVPLASGFNYPLPRLRVEGLSYGEDVGLSHSVVMDDDGHIRVRFFPIAVDLCLERFKENEDAGLIRFEHKPDPYVATTQRVSDEWHVVLDRDEWKQHREELNALVGAVNDAWLERLRTPT